MVKLKRFLLLVAIVGIAFAGLAAFRVGPPPSVQVASTLPAIGQRTPIQLTAAEPKRGLSRLEVQLVQGDRTRTLESREFTPRPPWQFWGPRTAEQDWSVDVGRETVEGLKEGSAKVRLVAHRAPSLLRAPGPAVAEVDLAVKLRPPQLQIRSTHTHVAQGGSEVVVYNVSEDSVRDGVQAGEWWFPGYPLPGGEAGDRFAFFAAPYDAKDATEIMLVASDNVGNAAKQQFVDRFFKKRMKNDTIRISDAFMERVVPAILSQTPEVNDKGNLLDNYLEINGKLREQNDAELRALAENSEADFLWRGEFMRMRNAKMMSDFADRRTYVYKGNPVDQQDHLGFDLASTRRAEIQAANAGRVVLARYFGIYGNTVVVDHGYGLMSLYGHLSAISASEGEMVERGQTIGRSGQTGLAGGDHLHFTMLLHGRPVNPREWWDSHWIHDRLRLKLESALPPAAS